jgi:hypothetical protein
MKIFPISFIPYDDKNKPHYKAAEMSEMRNIISGACKAAENIYSRIDHCKPFGFYGKGNW